MYKRILSTLLALAMFLPVVSAFAATTMGNVALRATHGQTITLTADDFTDQLTLDPADAGATLVSVTFPALPSSVAAVILLDGAAYVADTAVPLADIAAGDLQVRVTAAVGTTVSIPFRVTLSNDADLDAALTITVAPEAMSANFTVVEGESVRITLGLREMTPEGRYLFSFAGDRNLQHGTLEPVAGEVGVFLYHATSVGVDSFTFTVTRDGVVSAPGTITITVTPSPIQPFLKYYDMPSHWASYAAGRLATLEKIIGHRVDSRFFFHPDRGITRGDFLIWLCSVMGIEPTTGVDTIFADRDIPVWMKGFIVAATEANIIEGVPSANYQETSYFLPHRAITRIEAIRMISAALGVVGHDDDLTGLFHDIESIPSWGRIHVRHLAELQIITGDGRGYLYPMRNLSRGEAAEMLYKALKEHTQAPGPGGPGA